MLLYYCVYKLSAAKELFWVQNTPINKQHVIIFYEVHKAVVFTCTHDINLEDQRNKVFIAYINIDFICTSRAFPILATDHPPTAVPRSSSLRFNAKQTEFIVNRALLFAFYIYSYVE